MRPAEVRRLLSVRRPVVRRTDRVLRDAATVDDFRRAACRRWPAAVRGYVEGGADTEATVLENRASYQRVRLLPSVLRDVDRVDTSTTIVGTRSPVPFALAPTGYTRMMHTDGEVAVARAAAGAGLIYTTSTMSTMPLEQIAAAAGERWFQLYVWRDRRLIGELLERARSSGYSTLVLTVDTPVTGRRLRDLSNGFTLPPRLTPAALIDMARHPAWSLEMLRGSELTFANFADSVSARSQTVMEFAAKQFDPRVTFDDLADLRRAWHGPLVVKGLLDPRDARRVVDLGADAVVLSNHGGRQLDQSVAPLTMLPAVRAEVGERVPLLVDGGIRSGTDLAIALASGADATLIGRAYLYGLGAAGERGVAAVCSILAEELARTMQLLGITSIDQLRAEGANLLCRLGEAVGVGQA